LNRDEVIGGVLMLLFGAVTAYFSLRMPVGTFRAAGSGLFPLGLGILLMGLSIVLLIKAGAQRKPVAEKKPSDELSQSAKQVILFTSAIALAILLFKELGYPLMSFLLLLALLRILGVRSWAYSLSLSLLTATGAYFLFVLWLQIPLPKGWIGL
jgi:putative tricarboxylic transport membrane protein